MNYNQGRTPALKKIAIFLQSFFAAVSGEYNALDTHCI